MRPIASSPSKILAAAALACVAAVPAAAWSQASEPAAGNVAPDARALVEKVQRFYEGTRDFQADFEQTYRYQAFDRTMKSQGTVAFRKPAMMRWDYAAPREKSFVVDGQDLWIWTPEDHQAVRKRGFTSDQLSTSITFLWGKGRLEDEFKVEKQGDRRLLLTPLKPQPGFARVVFEVDPATGQVVASTVVDSQGNENHVAFSNVRLNTGLAESRFRFVPPEGADVQELTDTGLR